MRSIVTGLVLACALALSPFATFSQSRRPLQIEDYYRVKSVGATQISPDGRSVLFTVSQRIEDDPSAKRENQSTTETYVVGTEAGGSPRLVQHDGRNVTNARWTDDGSIQYAVDRSQWKVAVAAGSTPVSVESPVVGRGGGRGGRGGGGSAAVPSADGKWIAETREKEQPKKDPPSQTDFEKRHQARFKGVTFDWKDFQRDGAPFPAPDPTAGNPSQLLVRPAGGGDARVLVDLDIRPGNVAWHPDGQTIAFTADATWRDDLKYSKTDLWTVTLDGKVTQLTKDGYVYSDVGYSPDGKFLCTRAHSAPT